MQTFKTILLPLLLTFQVLSLVGCDLPKPKEQEGSTVQAATFSVDTVKGTSLSEKNSNTFTFPTDKIFNFAVCLKDVAYSRPIAGHVFNIKEINKDVTTDKAGCLNWGEDLKYNYLAAPEYIKIQRTIVAKGLHRGSRQVHFAINPWADIEKVPDVLDADRNDVPQMIDDKDLIKQVLQGVDDTSAIKIHPLYVADGNLLVTQQSISVDDSGTFALEARVAPQVQMTKLNGDIFYQALTAGKFTARMKIIHSYMDGGNTVHRLLAQTPTIDATLKNGFLTLDSSVEMVKPTRGQLILGLELSPVNGPAGLGPFNGVFILGDYDQFKGNVSLKLNTSNAETTGFDVRQFITAVAATAMTNNTGAAGVSGSAGSATSTAGGSTASPVTSSSDSEAYEKRIAVESFTYTLRDYDYKIDSSLNMIMIKSFQVTILPHVVASSNQSVHYSDSPKLRDGKYLVKMAMVHNFDYDSTDTFVTSSEKIVQASDGALTDKFDFKIHDLTELVNRNSILLEIYPVDESKVQTVDGEISLIDPKASLDSAILTNTTLQSPTFIGSMFLIVDDSTRQVHKAEFLEAQHFLSKNFLPSKATGLIARAIEQSHQTTPKIAGPLTPADFAAQSNLDLVSVKQMGGKSLRQALQVNTILGTKTNQLERYEQDHIASYELTAADMSAIIHGNALSLAAAHKLCSFWLADYLPTLSKDKGGAVLSNFVNSFAMECGRQITTEGNNFFQIEKRLFVKELEENDPQHKPQMLHGNHQDLGIGTNFSLSAYHTKSQNSTWSLSTKLGLGLRVLGLFSGGFDGGYSMSWVNSTSNSSGNTVSMTSNLPLTVQQNTFALRFNKYEQCAVVHLNPHLFMKQQKEHWYNQASPDYTGMLNPRLSDLEKGHAVTHGLLICDGIVQTTPIDRVEDYSLIYQKMDFSQTQQDMGDARNRNFYLALRSTNDLESFLAAIKGNLASPINGSYDQNQVQQTNGALLDLFNLAAPSAPGTYLETN